MNKNIFKSIGTVDAGFITVAILSIGTDYVFESLGIFPPQSNPGAYVTWMLALALFYRSIYTVVGGYVTVLWAPQNPIRHVYALMVLGGIGGIAGLIDGWHLGNHWYTVTLAITGPLFVLLGGKLKMNNP
ncbi:MAG: hypothetical protein HYR79_10475 [Nitrospirae bacterium]|nr:hypothetical protein [Nitrospirota bacterium]